MSQLSYSEIRTLHRKCVICPSCKDQVPIEDMTEYRNKPMCEGCAETNDMFDNSDDPHGKNWGNDENY